MNNDTYTTQSADRYNFYPGFADPSEQKRTATVSYTVTVQNENSSKESGKMLERLNTIMSALNGAVQLGKFLANLF